MLFYDRLQLLETELRRKLLDKETVKPRRLVQKSAESADQFTAGTEFLTSVRVCSLRETNSLM
jgi:hypothetical protein